MQKKQHRRWRKSSQTHLVGKVSETWQVIERYLYDAYGRATVLDEEVLRVAEHEGLDVLLGQGLEDLYRFRG